MNVTQIFVGFMFMLMFFLGRRSGSRKGRRLAILAVGVSHWDTCFSGNPYVAFADRCYAIEI